MPNPLEDLIEMFNSGTIKPTFDFVHIILALFIFEENPYGIGRYRLRDELSIGSGTSRSLITKLNEKMGFLTVLGEKNKRKGHVLTENGLKYLSKIKKKIPFIKEGDFSILNAITIESESEKPYFCLVKNASNELTNGIAQRDAAIKINGTGASCLVYDGTKFEFPLKLMSDNDKEHMKINENVQKYFKNIIKEENLNLEKGDVVIIGLGRDSKKARLAALNAALTLI